MKGQNKQLETKRVKMKIILNFNGQKKWQSQEFNFKEAKIYVLHTYVSIYLLT